MIKKIIILMAFAAVLAFAATDSYAASKHLDVPVIAQEQNVWCWAATCQMILRYYDRYFVEQCEIAEYARLKNPGRFGLYECCYYPHQWCNETNYILINEDPGNMEDILRNYNVNTSAGEYSMTYSQCKTELNANRPFIIGYQGHVIVANGYYDQTSTQPNRLYIIDPWWTEGAQLLDYDVIKDYYPGFDEWTYTLKAYPPNTNNDGVRLYDYGNFGGSSTWVNNSVGWLWWFNNKASSAKVRGIPFIAYDYSYYGGTAWPLTPRDYSSYTEWDGSNNSISSIMEMPYAYDSVGVILFEDEYYGGNYWYVPYYDFALSNNNFGDKASSLIVIKGIYRLYDGNYFSGYQYGVTSFGGPNRDGFYPTAADWGGFDNDINSVYWAEESWETVILYEHEGLRGRAMVITSNDYWDFMNDFSLQNFDNKTSSIKTYLYSNMWRIYEGANQTGTSSLLDYPNAYLIDMDFFEVDDNSVSSIGQ